MEMLPADAYQQRAEALYWCAVARLKPLLPSARWEHVGASAIPGAISKGDLDICIVVPATEHPATVAALEGAGYRIKPNTLRTPNLCMLEHTQSGPIDVALQVITAGSRFEFFMHFRDALRADPALVRAYNDVKTRHADQGSEPYRRAKAAFIERVLADRAASA